MADGLRRKKIAIVVPSFEDIGGVGTVAEFILRAIARRPNLEAMVVSLATSSRDPCSVLLRNPATWRRGIRTRQGHSHHAAFTHVGAVLGEIEICRLSPRGRLADLLKDCDMIQVVAGVPAWANPVLDLGKPIVLQIATLTGVERQARLPDNYRPLTLWRRAMTRIVSRMDNTALRQCGAVMVENPWMLQHVKDIVHDGPVLVRYAPPGVDADFFFPGDAAPPESEPRYILAVGRFSDARKNAMLLLEAYAELKRAMPDAPGLVLAGSHGPGETFWTRAQAYGLNQAVSFHAMPSNHQLAGLYRGALCLALPSEEEGFGMVVVEAMASGIPVVATRCGGPDGIIADGEDGYLIPCGDALAMANRLEKLAANPVFAREMGRKARATVEARYADKVAGDVFLEVYDALLGTPSP